MDIDAKTNFSTIESSFSLLNLVKRTSWSSLLLSVVLLFGGILLFVFVFHMHNTSSTLNMAFLVLATGFVLLGIFRFFWRTKRLYYLPTGSEVTESFMFFDLKDLNNLKALIAGANFYDQPDFRSQSGGNIRLHTLITRDNKFAAVQLYQFIPYTYSPVTPVCCFKDDEAAAFSAFLVKCRK